MDVALKPNATQLIDVAALQAQKVIPADAHWASVIVSAPVQVGDLMAVAASYDSTGRYGAQTPFSDQLASHWEGGKWEVDSTHNSLVTVGNGGRKPARAELTILYNHGRDQYQIEQTLAPDEQMLVDFGKLIRNQVPDRAGHVLPPDLTTGAYRLRDLADVANGGLYEGKLIVDKTYGHAAYGCMICCGPEVPLMEFDPLSVVASATSTQTVQAPNSCGGGTQNVTGDFPTWWTDNTAIATASRNQIHGVAVGTTKHHAQSIPMYWGFKTDDSSCPQSQPEPSAGTNVVKAVPTNFHLTSASDDGGGSLPLLDSFFSWQSSSGNLADLSACSMREYVTYPNTNNSTCTVNGVQQQCYFPPSPPWASSSQSGSGYPNPSTPTPGPATGGNSEDQNSVGNLNFVKPYSSSSFAATQYVQYSCSGGPWTNLYGPVTITRSMGTNSSGKWAVTVSRSDTGVSSSYVIPNQ